MQYRRLVVLATLVAAVATSAAARAQWTVGADAAMSIPVGEPETHPGWLADGRVGYRFHLKSLSLGPEIGGGYGVYTPIATARKATGFFFTGARLGLDFVPVVTPYALGRFGYGVASTDNLPDPNQRSTFASGAYIELGGGVAKRFTRAFELGLEGSYTTIEPGECFCSRWVRVGLAGTVLF